MHTNSTHTPPPSRVNPATVKRVYAALLLDAAGRGGTSAMSSRDIAQQLVNVSDRTVRRALNVLEQDGLIVMPKRRLDFYSARGFGWVENAIVVTDVATAPALGRAYREKAAIRRRHERYVASGRARPRRPKRVPETDGGHGGPRAAGG